jgi:hypothetical protein
MAGRSYRFSGGDILSPEGEVVADPMGEVSRLLAKLFDASLSGEIERVSYWRSANDSLCAAMIEQDRWRRAAKPTFRFPNRS